MKMTFQEIRIIATGPCIANQLRDVNTICGIWERVQRYIEKSLFMGGLILYLRYMCLFACSGIQLISVCLSSSYVVSFSGLSICDRYFAILWGIFCIVIPDYQTSSILEINEYLNPFSKRVGHCTSSLYS